MVCSALIGTRGSPARYSTKATLPPGFRARTMLASTSNGCESSWYTSTMMARSTLPAGRATSSSRPRLGSMFFRPLRRTLCCSMATISG